jgi:SAM-dependent methyltransferase
VTEFFESNHLEKPMQPIHDYKDLDTIRRAAGAYAAIAAWAGAKLFDVLADGQPRKLSELPAHPRALQTTAPVLAHLGLLCHDGDLWAMSQTALQLHEEGALDYKGAEEAVGHLSKLDQVMQDGQPIRVTEGGVVETDIERARGFMDMLYQRSARSATEVVRWIGPRLPEGGHVLDVGGGHGRYADALVDAGFTATLFDRGVCVDIARERYEDKMAYLTGDFLVDDLGGPYDCALLSNIVHGMGAGEMCCLFKRLREVLNPGGLLVIKDMIIDDLGMHTEHATMFGMTMLLFTREGRSYDRMELNNFLRQSTLTPTAHVVIPDGGYSLLIARK